MRPDQYLNLTENNSKNLLHLSSANSLISIHN
jgi:hypothetical protein